jgi:hypothetical protein
MGWVYEINKDLFIECRKSWDKNCFCYFYYDKKAVLLGILIGMQHLVFKLLWLVYHLVRGKTKVRLLINKL